MLKARNWKLLKNPMKSIKAVYLKIILVSAVLALMNGCSGSSFEAIGEGSDDLSSYGEDPLFKYAWHLSNTGQLVFANAPAVAGFDMNLTSTWAQNIHGSSVLVQVSDDGIEDTHEDLRANFSYANLSKNYSLQSPFIATKAAPIATTDNHGTSVAGLIAAVGWNARGSRGVAPNAKLLSANFLSDGVSRTSAKFINQASGSFDISNMSWGTTQNMIYDLDTDYETQLASMATSGRNGKGTLFVKAAGNDFAVDCNGSTNNCIGSSNFDSDNVNPYITVVAALNALGESASYSSIGSDIWISSFGGEFGDDSPAMMTTDRSTCRKGYSVTAETIPFEKGNSNENAKCNYTSSFNGTSSAAPTVSGAMALLLEANPNLTWREIKYILAKTATVDNFAVGGIAHPLRSTLTLPVGFIWEQKWVNNSAGFKFHNFYGFGRVNVDAAVTMAKAFAFDLGIFSKTNWVHLNSGLNLAIPDNNITGVSNSLTVVQNYTVEAVQIRINITHADISQLALELTSPNGTKSILVNARNSLVGLGNYQGEVFLSNAFYQEPSAGNWILKVIDAKSGNTGTLTSFGLNIFGGSH